MTDALVLELRAMRAELAEVREAQADLLRRLLAREDRRIGAALLPLAAELVGPRDFDAGTLAAVALNDRTDAGQAVRELIADFTDDDGGFRALAKLLQRLQGAPLGGCKLVSAPPGRGGLRWRVQVFGG